MQYCNVGDALTSRKSFNATQNANFVIIALFEGDSVSTYKHSRLRSGFALGDLELHRLTVGCRNQNCAWGSGLVP